MSLKTAIKALKYKHMAKTIQKVVTIAVTVELKPDAQHYNDEEINNALIVKSADKGIKVTSHIAEEMPA